VDATLREQILAAARCLGAEKFNRLVDSVDQVRAAGRLRYWQEEFLANLENIGIVVAGPTEFIAVFDQAPLMPRFVTREEFFTRANYWYYLGGAPIPDEWIAEAWEQVPEFRDNVTYEFVREASKVGELDAIQASLERLGRILPLGRVVEIYEKVRQDSPHRESEFRPTFERLFGDRMSSFPEPLEREEVVEALQGFGLDRATAVELMAEDPDEPDGEIPF
jgi:hypothetical protein